MKMRWVHILCLLVLLLSGCIQRDQYDTGKPFSRVLLIYTAGYNNLSSDIGRNIQELCDSPLPLRDGNKAILVFSHQARSDYDYRTEVQPCLVRISADWQGQVVRDTLLRLDANRKATDPFVLNQVIEYVHEHFDSDHYGLIMSSHGTGWMPQGYYDNPTSSTGVFYAPRKAMPLTDRVAAAPEDGLKVKSFGADVYWNGNTTASAEMDVMELVRAITIHLDYIIFDACLMGGIEVAYELRNVADKIGFSQAEILAHGFPYKTTTQRLMQGETDVTGFCQDYYEYYAAQQGVQCSATISVVDSKQLDAFAQVCKALFSRYSSALAAVDPATVQGYFRKNRHWFYDLDDIFVKAGASEADLATLRTAMDQLILYKAATKRMLDAFDVNVHCGLSMYLPANGDNNLNAYYRKLAWNQVTGLVK